MNRRIELRKYYAVRVELFSPLSVSNGQDFYTDSDVMRNGRGELFVPGTSLAGAFRNYLGMEKNKKCIMGYSDRQEGSMSALFISDLYFEDKPVVSVRDGVMLTEEKTVDNKFDMEIIETGAQGNLYLNFLVREGEKQEEFESAVDAILQEIQNGAIRLGANKTRGFGRLRVREVYEKTFRSGDVDAWMKFMEDWKNPEQYLEEGKKDYSYKAWAEGKKAPEDRYIRIRVPLKLTGGISIRRYSARPGQTDFEHITCNGHPVIPGTSWNGAIRSDAREILKELGCGHPDRIIKQWFGNIDEKDAHQSQLIVGESVIEGAVRLEMTRNKINRFDASTIDGALYSEAAYFGGETCLELFIRKDNKKEYLALLGMMLLVIGDIQKGYVAVGGQTAVGRGIFAGDTERKVDYSEAIAEDSCMSALYTLIA